MTLLMPDARSPRFLPNQPHSILAVHSMPASPLPAYPSSSVSPPPMLFKTSHILSGREHSDKMAHDRAFDITAHSWDVATGDLKTLTAKRELPLRLDGRPSEKLLETMPNPHSYMFALAMWACVVAMLISGGIVLFVMVQP